ncbi:MAG: hypothetical protein HYW65_04035 [Candidatus Liptonbacteria bacterium]|nr:hypothetical protein [Candidatus Liptonbacteria bacterium]
MPLNPADLIWQFLDLTKWFWVFLILLPLTASTWLGWRQFRFEHSAAFRMGILEMRIPREIRKSPRAMEQVFMAIHALRNYASDPEEVWWDGEITRRFTFEITSFGGEIRFFVRFYNRYRPLVEAAFLSYYPDVELVDVDDYIEQIPKDMDEMYARDLNMWGAEMELRRPEAYPIRSYAAFEAPDEERQYDPIASMLETLAKVKKGEFVGIQLVTAPKNPHWHEKWAPFIEKLKEQSSNKPKPPPTTKTEFPGGVLPVFSLAGQEEESPFKNIRISRTPGETNVLEAVENNLSKPAFDVILRFAYISPLPLFYESLARRAVGGIFNQYAAQDLNHFGRNEGTSTRVRFWHWPYFFPKKRAEWRKAVLLHKYRHREMPPETFMAKVVGSRLFQWDFASKEFVMNVESLATLFHPPTFLVLTAPHIRRVESRKTGPPAGLAIYGDEKEIQKFQ